MMYYIILAVKKSQQIEQDMWSVQAIQNIYCYKLHGAEWPNVYCQLTKYGTMFRFDSVLSLLNAKGITVKTSETIPKYFHIPLE